MTVIARTTSWGCPNRHPTWHCWRCRVDAVEVEYVTLRADDYQGAVEALNAVSAWLASPQPNSSKVEGIRRALEDPEYAAEIAAKWGR